MDIKSKLVKLGKDPKKQKGFINPAIYKGSTIILENCITKLYNSDDTVIAPSGLSALVIPFFSYLK